MQIARRLFRQAGVTLVETSVVTAIAGTLLATAIPSFQDMLARRQLEGAVTQLATDVLFARSDAVARAMPSFISFGTTASGTCYVIHTGSRGACACQAEGPAVCRDDATELKSVALPGHRGVRLQSNTASMQFNPVDGTTTPGATVRLTRSDGAAVHQVINIMGRPRACSPGARVPGYKAC